MMNKYKRKGFLLHAKSKEYKSKVKYSLQIIREAFEGNSCYVSFSGGKDSAVLTLRCKSILLKSIPYSEIQWYCDIFDQYVLETNTIDEAIELFRDENPVNNNIAVGTAKGRIRSKFNELKEEANQYGFNLVDFIEEAGLNSDYFE